MSQHTYPVMASVPGFGGNSATAELFRVLGETLGSAGAGLLEDPEIQAAIENMLDQCEVKAREGGTKFFQENWPWFLLGGSALVGGNFIMMFVLMSSMLSGRKVIRNKDL
tara:strand:+ start:57 stop:386 length:330 start_codon:yes stop_codon:yes gene_type:complete